MKKVIHVEYSQLKLIYLNIVEFLETDYAVFGEKITSKSSLNFDIGIDGDDAAEFLGKFSSKYDVKFQEFNFYKYFSGEGSNIGSLSSLPFLITVVVQLIFAFFLHWIFPNIKTKVKDLINNFNEQSTLTIGDLVASCFNGEFIERKDVIFITK